MRIVNKKERSYRHYIERFDLNGSYAGKSDIPLGILLLYILVKDCNTEFCELSAEADGDIGEPRNILNETDKGIFSNVKDLADLFETQELVIWDLTCIYNGTKISIAGRPYGSILSIMSPIEENVNMIPLMSSVENATYNYHEYATELVSAVKSRFGMNQKAAIQALEKLKKHKDIYDEFTAGISNEGFSFVTENPAMVEGYTAKILHENYPLSALGAYNYLIYLREEPKSALKGLENGLPIR